MGAFKDMDIDDHDPDEPASFMWTTRIPASEPRPKTGLQQPVPCPGCGAWTGCMGKPVKCGTCISAGRFAEEARSYATSRSPMGWR